MVLLLGEVGWDGGTKYSTAAAQGHETDLCARAVLRLSLRTFVISLLIGECV